MPSLTSSPASLTSSNGLSSTVTASTQISHGVTPTTIAVQSSISGTSLFPTASATYRIISESSLKASTLQPTISKIHPQVSNSNLHVSAMSPTPSLSQSIASEASPEVPETQPTMSEIAPAPLDTRERSVTEPDFEGPSTQVTIKTISTSASASASASASVPDTQPTVAKIVPTEPTAPVTDPETARKLDQVDPNNNNTAPKTFPSKVRELEQLIISALL